MERIGRNPLNGVKKLNAQTDRRHVRGAFDEKALHKLFAVTTRRKGTLHGMTGPARAMLYRFAAYTGIRWSELFSLTAASFDLEGETPTVRIEAKDEKARRGATLALRPDVAEAMRAFLADHKPGDQAFTGMWRRKGAEMLQDDLKAAGLPYQNETGACFDFHSLRMTCGTLCARAGVPLTTTQKQLRHSTPTLTALLYTAHTLQSHAEEMKKLPTIPMTGDGEENHDDQRPPDETGGRSGVAPGRLVGKLVVTGKKTGDNRRLRETVGPEGANRKTARKPNKKGLFSEENRPLEMERAKPLRQKIQPALRFSGAYKVGRLRDLRESSTSGLGAV